MSKLKEHLLNEMINSPLNNPQDIAKQVEGTFEDMLFQLETIVDMEALNMNLKKKLSKEMTALRRLGMEVSKEIKAGVGR